MKVLFLIPSLGNAEKNIVRDFVYGCWCNGKRIGGMQMPPLNDLYCATHVRNCGIDVLFLDAQVGPEKYLELLTNEIDSIDAVVVLTSTQSFKKVLAELKKIKEIKKNLYTIIYGSHPTFMPEHCLKEEVIDYIILHEPEESLRCLLLALQDQKPISDILGIGYRDGGRIILTPKRDFLNMDTLPIPDRTLLSKKADYFNPVVHRLPYTTMQTSRGCPGKCIFCTAPSFSGNKYRFRSAENVLEEMRSLKKMGYREIFIRDEVFTAIKPRNMKICEAMIKERLNFTWIANGRVDLIDKESMVLMKKAGCHMIKFGIESGDFKILENLNKGTTPEQAQKVFQWARDLDLETHAHMMIGCPGETTETIAQSVAFAKKLKPTTISFGILTPYPGTVLFDRVAKEFPQIADGSESNMTNLHTEGFYSEAICDISGEQLSKEVVQAYRSFYFRPGYILKRLFKIRGLEQLIVLVIGGLNILHFSFSGKK
jgi:anaerobic magnesium-protoporphyrin IX monomethyl ester cyclase